LSKSVDTVYTIGYSNHSIDEFLNIIRRFKIEVVVDVRRFPKSRLRGFSKDELEVILGNVGVSYKWFGVLGALGLRFSGSVKCVDSQTFNSYVNYLLTSEEVYNTLRFLSDLASKYYVLIMCRELNPKYCHRQFIADVLSIMGFKVLHIVRGDVVPHERSNCYEFLKLRYSR
jgi:uncharacterized protein (DUF488 family)